VSGPVLRVADVADTVVSAYLYALLTRMSEDTKPKEAWFRVTPGKSTIPLTMGEIVPIEQPTFEVVVVVDQPVTGLGSKLTQAAATMSVRVMPHAIMAGEWVQEDFERGGWRQVPMPQLTNPELAGV
jgi:hypothetical protein